MSKDVTDFHRLRAAAHFDCKPSEVTPAQRAVGKALNFYEVYAAAPPMSVSYVDLASAELHTLPQDAGGKLPHGSFGTVTGRTVCMQGRSEQALLPEGTVVYSRASGSRRIVRRTQVMRGELWYKLGDPQYGSMVRWRCVRVANFDKHYTTTPPAAQTEPATPDIKLQQNWRLQYRVGRRIWEDVKLAGSPFNPRYTGTHSECKDKMLQLSAGVSGKRSLYQIVYLGA